MPRGTPEGSRPEAPTQIHSPCLTMSEDHLAFNKAKDEAALNTGPGEIQLGGTSANAKEKPICYLDEALLTTTMQLMVGGKLKQRKLLILTLAQIGWEIGSKFEVGRGRRDQV